MAILGFCSVLGPAWLLCRFPSSFPQTPLRCPALCGGAWARSVSGVYGGLNCSSHRFGILLQKLSDTPAVQGSPLAGGWAGGLLRRWSETGCHRPPPPAAPSLHRWVPVPSLSVPRRGWGGGGGTGRGRTGLGGLHPAGCGQVPVASPPRPPPPAVAARPGPCCRPARGEGGLARSGGPDRTGPNRTGPDGSGSAAAPGAGLGGAAEVRRRSGRLCVWESSLGKCGRAAGPPCFWGFPIESPLLAESASDFCLEKM